MHMVQLTTKFGAVRSAFCHLIGQRVAIPVLALAGFGVHAGFAQQPIDAGLYTTYTLKGNVVSWSVCGQTQITEGCFGGGNLGPFGKVGALLEGDPTTDSSTQTVTRAIYALDIAAGKKQTRVDLYIYQKKDVISSSDDQVTVTLSSVLNLPLLGGTTELASMAANTNYLVIATASSPHVVEVAKSTLAITQFGGPNVHAVTADAYGYITIENGKFDGSSTGFLVVGPDGMGRGSGGGSPVMLNTTQAILPRNLK